MLSDDMTELISQDQRVAFDPASIRVMREIIGGGDPWPIVEEVHKINAGVAKTKLYDALGLQANYLTGNDRGHNDDLRLVPMSELVASIRGPQYLIKPYLEADTVGTVYGESGTFKSFIMLDLCLSVAYGVKYHNHPVKQGAVIYVCGEGAGGLSRRIEAWRIHHGLTDKTAPFFMTNLPVELVHKPNAKRLADLIEVVAKQARCEPALVVIDTLSANAGDADENDNTAMAKFIKNLNTDLRMPFNACVRIVHHTGHADKDRERGAYAIRGNVDCRILVKSEGDMKISIHCMKTKDSEPFPPVVLQAKVTNIPGVLDSEREEATSLVLDMTDEQPAKRKPKRLLSPRQQIALESLSEALSNHNCLPPKELIELSKDIDVGHLVVKIEHWRDAFYLKIGDDVKRKDEAFRRTKESLSAKNEVIIHGEYCWLPVIRSRKE